MVARGVDVAPSFHVSSADRGWGADKGARRGNDQSPCFFDLSFFLLTSSFLDHICVHSIVNTEVTGTPKKSPRRSFPRLCGGDFQSRSGAPGLISRRCVCSQLRLNAFNCWIRLVFLISLLSLRAAHSGGAFNILAKPVVRFLEGDVYARQQCLPQTCGVGKQPC